jgi:hypothetical protein
MSTDDRMVRKTDGTYTVTRVDTGLTLAAASDLLKDRPTLTPTAPIDNGEVHEVHFRG